LSASGNGSSVSKNVSANSDRQVDSETCVGNLLDPAETWGYVGKNMHLSNTCVD